MTYSLQSEGQKRIAKCTFWFISNQYATG